MITKLKIKFILLLSVVLNFSLLLIYIQYREGYVKNHDICFNQKPELKQKISKNLLKLGSEHNVVNPFNHEYILNPEYAVCGQGEGANVTLLAMVHSSLNNFDKRFLIRSTWASKSIYPNRLKVIFLIGKSDNNSASDRSIQLKLKYLLNST